MINGLLVILVLLKLMLMINHGNLLTRLILMWAVNWSKLMVRYLVIYVAVCSKRPVI